MPIRSGLKNNFLDDLWLPVIHKFGSSHLAPSKKNKEMKVLTLTSDHDYQEIARLEEDELTTKQYVTAWTYSHIKKLRLETEISPAKVAGTTRFEDSISSTSLSIKDQFPFHLINLDFSSQDPSLEIGRIEKEIACLERTIKTQKDAGGHNFILAYATIINSSQLDYSSIVDLSNSLLIPGWPGLSVTDFPPQIDDQENKMRCIRETLAKMCSKYIIQIKTNSACLRVLIT
jgi:hypothetical protein